MTAPFSPWKDRSLNINDVVKGQVISLTCKRGEYSSVTDNKGTAYTCYPGVDEDGNPIDVWEGQPNGDQ